MKNYFSIDTFVDKIVELHKYLFLFFLNKLFIYLFLIYENFLMSLYNSFQYLC